MPRTSPIRPRILIIERDIEIQKGIAQSLDGVFTTDLTSSGSLAMLLMKDYRYSCILTSTQLPNRHRGRGILQALRGMPGGRYVPIIATVREGLNVEPHVSDEFITTVAVPSDIDRIEQVITAVLEAWD